MCIVCMTFFEERSREDCENGLDKLIETASDLYILKKQVAYLLAFTEYFVAKAKNVSYVRPVLNATFLDRALIKAIKFAQSRCFGAAVDLLSRKSPDDFETFLNRWARRADNSNERRRV